MKKSILFVTWLLAGLSASGQEVRGKVFEKSGDGNRIPLTGVNVYWAGTTQGTITNTEGDFSINWYQEPEPGLVFSYVGFVTDTVPAHMLVNPVQIVLARNIELDEVTIHGRQKGSHLDRLNPIHTHIISSAGLQQAACCNLSESFETSASVDVNYSDALSGAKQIMMLGLSGIYSQLMTENVPNHRGLGSTYGLGYIPGTWMESIQVSKGTSSVVNGFESITGQINIEFKKPENSEKLFLNFYGNDNYKYDLNFNSSIMLSEKWSTGILAHYEDLRNRTDMNGDGFMDLPLVRQLNFMNRWKYQGDKGFESRFGLNLINEQRIGGQMVYNPGDQPGPANGYGITLDTRRYEAYMKNGYIFSSRPATSVGLITSATVHQQDALFGINRYSGEHNSIYGNFLFQSFIGNTAHGYTTGISFIADQYDESLNDSIFTHTEWIPGIYFQYTYQPSEDFTLMAGIRADHHNRYGGFVTPRIHLRYNFAPGATLRTSAGKGYRTANIIAENSFLLASSRKIEMLEQPEQESAWNYGLNLSRRIPVNGKELLLSAEYYRTDFQNQIVVDMEQDIGSIRIYNLDGKSYSNSWQFDLSYELFRGFDLNVGYRITDVKATIHNKLQEKPLVNRYKGLLSTSYATKLRKWQFDLTLQLNGNGRLPETDLYPIQYSRPERYPNHSILHGQVTKRFKHWDIYLGGENLTNYRQKDPILAYDDPFGNYFDASMIWGPIMGRIIYFGIRIQADRN